MNIVYKPILINLTGNTTDYSGVTDITPGISISSGVTFNINDYYDTITKNDLIDNIVNYIDDYTINKYMLKILIVANVSGQTLEFATINNTSEYCIKLSYNNEIEDINEIEDYLIIKVFKYNSYDDNITTTTTIQHTTTTTTTTAKKIRIPTITYNYPVEGTSWDGGNNVIPYNVFLPFDHDGISGWTLDSLKTLFISGITDCYDGEIPISSIIFNLYKTGSQLLLMSISENGIYDIIISVTNTLDNTLTNSILHIIVNDTYPIIVYRPYVIDSDISWNTDRFSGVTSGITGGIDITSGFTFNIGGFDRQIITRLDIIDNIVNYVYDYVDLTLNKYMLDILIVGTQTHETINHDGVFCVKISISNTSGHKTVNYFMMNVISDILQSCYSQGFWQDNKVWIDFKLWLDQDKPIK